MSRCRDGVAHARAAQRCSAALLLSLVLLLAQSVCAGTYFGPRTDYPTANFPESVAIGDLNGDGRLDLVAACASADSVCLFFGNGDGTFQPRRDLPTGADPVAVALADLNGDQKLDIITVERNANAFSVMLGNGDGTFGPRMTTTGPFGGPKAVAIGYLDGDANLDVVVAQLSPHGFSTFLGHGDGTFGSAAVYQTSVPQAVALGNVNADGHQDVLVANESAINIYPGNGDGTLGLRSTLSLGVFQSGEDIALGDLNRDGKVDLVVPRDGGGMSVWLGNGDETFGTRTDYSLPLSALGATILDLNGDGFQDIAVATSGAVSVFSGTGDGTFASRADFTSASGTRRIVSGDLDADARPDIAVSCYASNTVSVFLNRTTVVDVRHSSSRLSLSQSQPNPAPDGATIRFSVQEAADITLRIYDVSGRALATLFRGPVTTGWHEARWNRRTSRGAIAPAGVYLYELRTNDERLIKRMTLLKPRVE